MENLIKTLEQFNLKVVSYTNPQGSSSMSLMSVSFADFEFQKYFISDIFFEVQSALASDYLRIDEILIMYRSNLLTLKLSSVLALCK